MKTKQYPAILLMLVCACTSAFAAGSIILTDDFANGNTKGWVSGQAGNVTFADGAMNVGVNQKGFHAAIQFDKVTLGANDTLSVAFDFTTPDSSTTGFNWVTGNAFRAMLMDTSTSLPNNSNPNVLGTGYLWGLNNLQGTNSEKSGFYYAERKDTTAGPLTNSITPWTVKSTNNNAFEGGLAADTNYTCLLSITNNGDGTLTLASILSGGDVVGSSQSWIITSDWLSYNTFAFGATGIFPMEITNVTITFVPEPALAAWLLGAAVLLLVVRRRR